MRALLICRGYPHQDRPVGLAVLTDDALGYRSRWVDEDVADPIRAYVEPRLRAFIRFHREGLHETDAFTRLAESSNVYAAWCETFEASDTASLDDLYAAYVEEHQPV